MINQKLSERFELIKEFYNRYKRMPTYSEMLKLFDLKSKNAVFKIISNMQHHNLLQKDEKSYLILKSSDALKLLGSVEAGFPSPAEEELLDTISLDNFLIKNHVSTFMLKVSGDSMIEAGILPKDFVLVDTSLEPKDKDIVIAQVDSKWTIKYLEKQKDGYVLSPANPKYKPIKPQSELIIAGVVIGVVRKYK